MHISKSFAIEQMKTNLFAHIIFYSCRRGMCTQIPARKNYMCQNYAFKLLQLCHKMCQHAIRWDDGWNYPNLYFSRINMIKYAVWVSWVCVGIYAASDGTWLSAQKTRTLCVNLKRSICKCGRVEIPCPTAKPSAHSVDSVSPLSRACHAIIFYK